MEKTLASIGLSQPIFGPQKSWLKAVVVVLRPAIISSQTGSYFL